MNSSFSGRGDPKRFQAVEPYRRFRLLVCPPGLTGGRIMRKHRDFDAALKALDAKAKQLRQRKVTQLGELVVATGADALAVEELVGALLAAVTGGDFVAKEEWRKRGAAFFRGSTGKAAGGARRQPNSDPARNRSSSSPSGEAGA